MTMPKIVIHGGCGTLLKENITTEREIECRQFLHLSTNAGMKVLNQGGPALQACIDAVKILEDSPQFNAGRGSVLSSNGEIEMDAGLMDGSSGAAAGVTCVRGIQNPILAAELVLLKTRDALRCQKGAEDLAKKHGLHFQPDDYFKVPLRINQLRNQLNKETFSAELDHGGSTVGTVGAVALDNRGCLAAASSTGGMSGKNPGRCSDSSVVGAGFWADHHCAVSGTGDGDLFIQLSACKAVADRIALAREDLTTACSMVVNMFKPIERPIRTQYPSVGFVALDKKGNISMPFNTTGMFRAYNDNTGEIIVKVFADE